MKLQNGGKKHSQIRKLHTHYTEKPLLAITISQNPLPFKHRANTNNNEGRRSLEL
jgi:hypothetical protein